MERCLILNFLLWSMANALSHPNITFMGEALPDHSYIDISRLGDDRGGLDSVQCHTNVETCCASAQGAERGDWFAPGGTRLPFPQLGNLIFEDREDQRVDLRRRNISSPTGIYRCEVPVSDGDDGKLTRKSAYVGLYTSEGGNVTITGGVILTVTNDLNGPNPQFTLTCISIGGPATNVTWTRDSVNFTDGTQTVLNDAVAAMYTHTLTVSGRPEGLYTCTVSNAKPSQDSAQINVEALPGVPEDFEAKAGEREVEFSWSAPLLAQFGGNISNYTISCTPSPSSLPQSPAEPGSLLVDGFSPDTLYMCSVAARNSRGTGPPAIRSFMTPADFVFFQVHLSGISTNCRDFESTNGQEKLGNVTKAVLQEFKEACRDCALTRDSIQEEYFACDPESPTYITYRARLEGTSQRDSGYLLALVEAWVRDGPNITAGSGELAVSTECSVEISSLTDPEDGFCEPPTSAATTDEDDPSDFSLQTIAIIAGVAGGVLLVFVIFLVVGLCLCCKYCCRKRKPPEEKALQGLSGVYIVQDKEKNKEDEAYEEIELEYFEKKQENGDQFALELEDQQQKGTAEEAPGSTQDTDDREKSV